MKSIRKLLSRSTFRLIILVIIVIVPINILTLVLSKTTIDEVERKMSAEVQSALNLYMSQIDGAIERITIKVHLLAIEDVDFARLNVKEVKDKEEYYNQLQSVVNLQNTMNDVIDDNHLVTGIFAYFPEKDIQTVSSKYTSYNRRLIEYLKKKVDENDNDIIKKWNVVNIDNSNIVLFIANKKNAYYGAWFDLKRLANTLDLDGLSDESFNEAILAFVDDSGTIYYSNTNELDINNIQELHANENNNDKIIVEAKSQYSKLSMVQIISQSEITNNLPDMIRVLQGASIVALLILPIIILSLKRWMLNPISKLTHAIQRIESGDMEFRIAEQKTGSEFEQINKNFNNMMNEVSTLKINVYEEQLEKNQIKMRFLSQQIKPHFILNALNILYSYEKDEYPLIQKMILCISKYFRYVVNANSDFIELHKEMEHIKNYFEIQEARYPETFYAKVEYEDDLYACLIPPLLIQNFAENAIKHSLQIGNQIEISVIAKRFAGEFVQVLLTDTGEGISDEILERIHVFRKTRIYQEGLGVGIQNSIERLEVFYGSKGQLNIRRLVPHGTLIEILLPIHLEEE
jgi:sensor histidine kinase YesM